MDRINENWECYLCMESFNFKILPTGYLSNFHPLCESCADVVLNDKNNKQRFRLTYHDQFGDLKIIAGVPVQVGHLKVI